MTAKLLIATSHSGEVAYLRIYKDDEIQAEKDMDMLNDNIEPYDFSLEEVEVFGEDD